MIKEKSQTFCLFWYFIWIYTKNEINKKKYNNHKISRMKFFLKTDQKISVLREIYSNNKIYIRMKRSK